MSTRDPRSFVASMLVRAGFSHDKAEELVQEALDHHAHELAEKQRNWLRDQGYETDCVCESCTACLAREYISLIDPGEEA